MFDKEYESIPTQDGFGFTLKEINKEKSYRWEDCVKNETFHIVYGSEIIKTPNTSPPLKDSFATEKQAKSASAFAQLTHIMEKVYQNFNWRPDWESVEEKLCIIAVKNKIIFCNYTYSNTLLAFPNEEIREIVYEQNKQLIHDYLMID